MATPSVHDAAADRGAHHQRLAPRNRATRGPVLLALSALALPLLAALAARPGVSVAHAAPDAAATPPAAGAPKTAAVAWKDMKTVERMKYMKTVVTPKMKTVFQEFDADLFRKFNCETCHGKNPKARKFKMPGPDVHPLPNTPEAFQAMMQKKPSWPKWTKFMAEKVEPPMGAMLGVPVFDPKKPVEGAFSCNACHTLEKS